MTRLKDVQLDIGTLIPFCDDKGYFLSCPDIIADLEVNRWELKIITDSEPIILSLADLERIAKTIKSLKRKQAK